MPEFHTPEPVTSTYGATYPVLELTDNVTKKQFVAAALDHLLKQGKGAQMGSGLVQGSCVYRNSAHCACGLGAFLTEAEAAIGDGTAGAHGAFFREHFKLPMFGGMDNLGGSSLPKLLGRLEFAVHNGVLERSPFLDWVRLASLERRAVALAIQNFHDNVLYDGGWASAELAGVEFTDTTDEDGWVSMSWDEGNWSLLVPPSFKEAIVDLQMERSQ